MKILAATTNAGKLREIRAILADAGVEVVGISDIGTDVEVIEDGATFYENARKKALAFHGRTGYPVLADDSGLVVDHLGGRPGVRSARYAGENATDKENYRKLLTEMAGVPDRKRGAAFVCAMVLVFGDGREITSEGRVEGTITTEPKGSGGFGYDPVFRIGGSNLTMAEAEESHKNKISHRAMALEEIARKLVADTDSRKQ